MYKNELLIFQSHKPKFTRQDNKVMIKLLLKYIITSHAYNLSNRYQTLFQKSKIKIAEYPSLEYKSHNRPSDFAVA